MVFAWDEGKNRINRRKHGISFDTAIRVFADPNAASYVDRLVDGEERWHTIGVAGGIALLLVVHTTNVPYDRRRRWRRNVPYHLGEKSEFQGAGPLRTQ